MNAKAIRLPSYQKIIISLSLLFALTALLLSYLAQYGWDIEPCKLCKLQRIPFFFVFLFSSLAFLPSLEKLSIRMVQVGFMASALLASYHLLVLFGILTDPCSVPKNILTLEDFQRMLETPVPCSRANWSLFRIPLPGYILFSSFIFNYTLFQNRLILKLKKN